MAGSDSSARRVALPGLHPVIALRCGRVRSVSRSLQFPDGTSPRAARCYAGGTGDPLPLYSVSDVRLPSPVDRSPPTIPDSTGYAHRGLTHDASSRFTVVAARGFASALGPVGTPRPRGAFWGLCRIAFDGASRPCRDARRLRRTGNLRRVSAHHRVNLPSGKQEPSSVQLSTGRDTGRDSQNRGYPHYLMKNHILINAATIIADKTIAPIVLINTCVIEYDFLFFIISIIIMKSNITSPNIVIIYIASHK